MKRHGRHWPREEQVANTYDGVFDLPGDDVAAARVKAGWAALLPPFEVPDDPFEPEFITTEREGL